LLPPCSPDPAKTLLDLGAEEALSCHLFLQEVFETQLQCLKAFTTANVKAFVSSEASASRKSKSHGGISSAVAALPAMSFNSAPERFMIALPMP
jgi:hypothetical protein